ncbi:MAG: hypothetical protein AAGF23_16245, partial [Acidobacteriota bacterium]
MPESEHCLLLTVGEQVLLQAASQVHSISIKATAAWPPVTWSASLYHLLYRLQQRSRVRVSGHV